VSAHERAARRLAALAGAERDWILARLARVDALRIGELMGREPTPAAGRVQGAPADAESTPESQVARAAAADVLQALRDEPDWLIALVLAQRRWPWDREVLNGLEPPRLEALAALARRAREAAKPRAGEAALGALAAKLHELAPAPQARSAFDDVLDGMTAGDAMTAASEPPQRGETWPS